MKKMAKQKYMIKRVIFLVQSAFNLRDYRRFGIEILQQNSFKVEVWDVSPVLYPNLYPDYTPLGSFRYDGLILFHDKSNLYSKVSGLKSSDFVMNIIVYNFTSFKIYRALSKSAADYAVFMAGALPTISSGKSKFFFYLKKLRSLTFKKVLDIIFPRLPFRWFGIKSAKLILAGGKKSLVYRYPVTVNTEVLWAHALDYDLYLKEKNILLVDRRIAVFLDIHLPFHSDAIYFKVKSSVSADKYYPLLNKFLNLVEKQLGLKVIIAAHPLSNYEESPDYFDGRKHIKGQTISLVKQSRLVLCHHTTALSFANLFYKPVVFLTSSELDKDYEGPYINMMAEWFGKKPIFIDRDNNIDWNFELSVPKEHYYNYRQAYIKTDHSEDLPFWQIVANRLKKVV